MNSQLEEALNGVALVESGDTAEKQHEEIEQLRKTVTKLQERVASQQTFQFSKLRLKRKHSIIDNEQLSPHREIRLSPEREISNSPERVNVETTERVDLDNISIRAPSDDDEGLSGECNEACENFKLDFTKLDGLASNENTGKPVHDKLAKLLNDNWYNKKSPEVMKKLLDKYNCLFFNPELWKILTYSQKKADLKFTKIQKSLIKTMSCALEVLEHAQQPSVDIQKIVQINVDMAAILGQAALDISYKRRLFIKSVLKEEYKDLASTTHEVTDFLFGDNLAKQVKELNLTNKLSVNTHKYVYKQKSEKQNYRNKPYYHHSSKNSFLGRGGGNPP